MTLPLKKNRLAMAAILTAAVTTQAANAAAVLEEVVVTAQKRAESLQDIPIAITAYNESALANLGIANIQDLALAAPSLQAYDFPTTQSNISIFIRGFGNTDSQTLTIDNPVGVYIDGVYIARTSGATIDALDLERVEILRGPQGTLYGRNSSAGAINFISKKPGEEFGGNISAGFGNFGAWEVGGTIDAPITDGLRSKISVATSGIDGWVENKGANSIGAQPGEDFYAKDQVSYRLALAWDITDSLIVDYSYDNSEVDSTPLYYQADPDNRQDYTSNLLIGGGAYQYVLPEGNTQSDGHNLTATWNLSDSMTLKSISSYREMEESTVQNWSDTLFFATALDWETEAVSQEFQFLGNVGDGFNYIVGLYYFEEEGEKQETQYTNFDGTAPTSTDALLDPGASTSVLLGGNNLGTATFDTDLESKAIYTQVSWTPPAEALENKLSIIAGMRYTEDEREATRGVLASNPTIQFPPGSNSLDYTHFDWNLVFDYALADDVSTYFKVATGYRAGGSAERALDFSQTFEEEEAISYELGLKSEMMDRRLRVNVVLFRTDYDDFLLTLSGETQNFFSFVENVNAGKAEVNGAELDVVALMGENTMVTFSYAYLDTELIDLIVPASSFLKAGPPASLVDRRGEDISKLTSIPFAPEHAASLAVDHTVPMDFADLDVHFDYSWRDSVLSQASQPLPVKSLGLFNARFTLAGMKLAGNKLDVALWGKNLADEKEVVYNLSGFGYQFNTPRTYGLDAKYYF